MCVSNRLSLLSHVTRGFSDLAPTNLLCFAVLDQNVNVSSIDDDDLEEEEVADVRARARWKSLRRSVRRWVLLLNADASPALTVASLWTRTGARSCTNEGQVQVPCEDQLALEGSEKFLITLFGHACYDVQLVADVPLDVYFYEAHGSFYAWRLRELDTDLGLPRSGEDGVQPSGGAPSTAANSRNGSTTTNATTGVAPLVGQVKNAHLCTQSRDCHRTLLGLARHGVYNLVVAYSNAGTAVSNDGILLRLVDCDSSSLSHILGGIPLLGLLFVASMGFLSMLLCLCLMGEYVLGLRSMTKLRSTLQRHHRFVELTQVEATKEDIDAPIVPLLEEPEQPRSDSSTADSNSMA